MVIRREHILAEIRRTAEENGGQPLGRDRFSAATGIQTGDWERYWPRWSNAVREAGLEPNPFQVPYDEDALLARLAVETRGLGRLPISRELRIMRREDPSLPSESVFARRLGTRRVLAGKLAAYCRERPDLADVAAIVEPLIGPEAAPAADDTTPEPQDFGFVYLLKSGRNYKLGRTNSVGRREYELAIQLPERVVQVHIIKTDDPVGIEAYWHSRFADRRKNGEWFELTAADISAFKRRKFM